MPRPSHDASVTSHAGYVAFRAIARSAGTTNPVLERIADRIGVDSHRFRASNGKVALGVLASDVESLLEALADQRSSVTTTGEMGASTTLSEAFETVIYVVVLDPSCRPTRVKVGVTDSLTTRVADFRTTCPECTVHARIFAPRTCEGYALALASTMGTRVGTEVFDFDSPESLRNFTGMLDLALSPFARDDDDDDAL